MQEFNVFLSLAEGARVRMEGGRFIVADNPIIPFIEGDGTGRDIWKAAQAVFDAAVEKAYGGSRKSSGTRFSPARRLSTNSANGCRKEPSMPSAS